MCDGPQYVEVGRQESLKLVDTPTVFLYAEYQEHSSTDGPPTGEWVLTDTAESSQLGTEQRIRQKEEIIATAGIMLTRWNPLPKEVALTDDHLLNILTPKPLSLWVAVTDAIYPLTSAMFLQVLLE